MVAGIPIMFLEMKNEVNCDIEYIIYVNFSSLCRNYWYSVLQGVILKGFQNANGVCTLTKKH